MRGLMMDTPLLITAIMRFAERNFASREIVTVLGDASVHCYTYADAFRRSRQLANALRADGVQAGDRVATLAWNDYRHFELYYAVSCSGAVCHTINPRLFSPQIEYIINHAADCIMFADPAFVPLLETMQSRLQSVRKFVVLCAESALPQSSLPGLISYEAYIADHSDEFVWPELAETTACALCYTSGTTGNPKGVLYSHRSTVLHAYAACLPDVFGIAARDCVMPLVPMFHVNAWGIPYMAPMTGARLVLSGPKMGDAETVARVMNAEGVTLSLGVPTVWLNLLAWLDKSGMQLETLERICIGGAACPTSLITRLQESHGVSVHHGWGMTELSPLGTYNTLKPGMERWSAEQQLQVRSRQGRTLFGIEMKICGADGAELPWDGVAFGDLKVRGPWVCSDYYNAEMSEPVVDGAGWFATGDVASIDAAGFMQITDRTKDVIKSGGEWISSIALENTAVDHPLVAEAAVIGVAHPRWGERPLLIVVPESGAILDVVALRDWFRGKVAGWWIPDDVVFVAELPHTATGKLLKTKLREQFKDYVLPAMDAEFE